MLGTGDVGVLASVWNKELNQKDRPKGQAKRIGQKDRPTGQTNRTDQKKEKGIKISFIY